MASKLSIEYLKQFENENIKRFLLDKDNIPQVEELLNSESQKLLRLQKLGLKLGRMVENEEVKELFSSVTEEVNAFLNLQQTIDCRYHYCGYKNAYDYGMEVVFLCLSSRENLISSIGHEYDHHIQYKQEKELMMSLDLSCFSEGHARGVQRYISNKYKELEGNEAFCVKILDYSVGELKSAYSWICQELGVALKESLFEVKSSRDYDEGIYYKPIRPNYFKLSSHAIGNTFFYLLEQKLGNQIYRDMINGKFELRKI